MEESVEDGREDGEPPRPFPEEGPVAVVDEVDGDVERELGVNSIDIMNLGHETGPSSGPNSVLGHYKFKQ